MMMSFETGIIDAPDTIEKGKSCDLFIGGGDIATPNKSQRITLEAIQSCELNRFEQTKVTIYCTPNVQRFIQFSI